MNWIAPIVLALFGGVVQASDVPNSAQTPQAYGTSPWNAMLKDKLEDRLNKEMCAGHISLKAARDMLVNDWRDAYKNYYGLPAN